MNEALEKWLERQGMSQAELARRLGYSAFYVNQVVRGKREVSDSFIGRFVQVFGPDEVAFFVKSPVPTPA
jgi:plasmid maintenance system antidote protein VapI